MSDSDVIKAITERIVNGFHPQRIILFGSRARGDAGARSDYDILVIMPLTKTRRVLMGEIDNSLWGLGIGRDIVILSDEEYNDTRDIPGTIAQVADKEGITIYEAA